MSYTLCIARFDEDISWTLPYAANIVICNKGKELAFQLPQIQMQNLGREEYAYLRFIVDHYDCLSDLTIFLQAGLKDHMVQYDSLRFGNEASLINHMLLQCRMFGNSANAKPHRLGQCSAHRNFKLADQYPHMVDSGKTFGMWFEENVRNTFPADPKWFKNGVFGVHKHHIRSRTKEYYENLIGQISTGEEHEIGHFLERSWFYVFNVDRQILPIIQ